jgi:hypothetical protein
MLTKCGVLSFCCASERLALVGNDPSAAQTLKPADARKPIDGLFCFTRWLFAKNTPAS